MLEEWKDGRMEQWVEKGVGKTETRRLGEVRIFIHYSRIPFFRLSSFLPMPFCLNQLNFS